MKYCYHCGRITTGEPLFCMFCGRTYDVKLCPRLHVNARFADCCSQCGSRELSTPQPKVSFYRKAAETLAISPVGLGQMNPQHCPRVHDRNLASYPDPLGEPLTIREVANILGCSVWTVRKQCLRRGLPYFRIGGTGKLVFYRVQVTRWILEQQQIYRGRR
jgi:hypothetical protein